MVAGVREQSVSLYLEGRLTDVSTNEVILAGVRKITGEELAGVKSQLETNKLNKGLGKAGTDMTTVFKELFAK